MVAQITGQPTDPHIIELPVKGMDCTHCVQTVQKAVSALPGVKTVEVFLTSEKAVVQIDPAQVSVAQISKAVEDAGYTIASTESDATDDSTSNSAASGVSRSIMTLFAVVFGVVLFIVVIGEWLGAFESITQQIPFAVGLLLVLAGGYPIFRNVVRATLRRQVIAHTLMTVGVIAALFIGEWMTALVVVFLMRVGEYTERFTAERSRHAVRDLTAMAPRLARVERGGVETEVPIADVHIGEIVVVRPGEQIPVDGEVISGQATINQAAITGESMPVETGVGAKVFAATLAQLGSLRVRVTHRGTDTTFGKVICLVEEAESHRADVQRIADKFSAYYLPVVATIAVLTFLIRRDPLSVAAVLLVACSCSFALATPIAMLASIGAGAKRGVLVKGGKTIELLERVNVLLVDKTGTLTLGRPQITQVVPLNGVSEDEIVRLAASAERYSEHPLAEAVRNLAREKQLSLYDTADFESIPGQGVRVRMNGNRVSIGNTRLLPDLQNAQDAPDAPSRSVAQQIGMRGQTPLYVARNGELIGILAAADTIRPEVSEALAAVRELGVQKIELLTGDNERVASSLASELGIDYRANLLPEDKIAVVKSYQQQGYRVMMVGDGVNDAPALAQADVGVAMGVAGTDVAIEAAHVTLMRDDWFLVPEVLSIARRTMRVVKTNILFTAVYNLFGLSLAAVGILPPILAAAAQSLPDLGILANSSRLLRYRANVRRS
jgi:P-type Cu+ transporter